MNMSSAEGDNATITSVKDGDNHSYGEGTFTGESSGHSGSASHSSHHSALAKSASPSTPSSHTLPRPRERSLTAAARSASPIETKLRSDCVYTSSHPAQAKCESQSHPTPAAIPEAAEGPGASAQDVRDTLEYRAAWDLELWKAVQADRFRKQLEKQKRLAFADLTRAVKQREKEVKAELAQRAQAVAVREEAVKAAETHLAMRQAKAAETEKEIRRMRQQLLEAQQRVEDEVRAQVRLANDTLAHRARLLEERVKAAEAQAKRADERQQKAQEEYLALYEAFSRYRMQQLTNINAASGNGLLTVSSTAALSSSLGPAFQLEQLRSQWDAEHRLQLDRQEQRHKTELAAAQERCRELEEQNRRLIAALARRRGQLRLMKAAGVESATAAAKTASSVLLSADTGNQPKVLSAHSVSKAISSAGAPSPPLAQDSPTLEAVDRLVRELHRLETDRVSLVAGSCGAVRETDAVIVRMDARMRELQRQLAAVQGAVNGAVVAVGV